MKKIDTDKLVRQFEDQPILFMGAVGTLLVGISKFIDAAGAAQGRRAYAKQVNYRVKNKK